MGDLCFLVCVCVCGFFFFWHFIRIYLSQTDNFWEARSQMLQFCSFFYMFEIEKGNKEDYMKVKKTRQGLDYSIGKIMCSLCFCFGC